MSTSTLNNHPSRWRGRAARVLLTFAVACVLPVGYALATGYPERPVTIVSAFPPGGIVDVIARRIAQNFSERFKQSFVVENRVGAAGSIGYSSVARALPDGHTLVLVSGPSTMAPPGVSAPTWQPQTAFGAIGMIGTIPQAIVVPNSAPVRSMQELVALARAKPGQLNYGSAGSGTTPFFTMEMLKSQQKVDLAHVPYRGQPEVMTDLVRGDIAVTAMTVPLVLPQVQAGKVRAIAVTSDKRLASMPEVATVAEQGMPNLAISNWFALMAPAKLPPEIVTALAGALNEALATANVRTSLTELGLAVQTASPAETQSFVQQDISRWISMSQALETAGKSKESKAER